MKKIKDIKTAFKTHIEKTNEILESNIELVKVLDECIVEHNGEKHHLADPVEKPKFEVGDYIITEEYSNEYDGNPLKITMIDADGYCYFTPNNVDSHNFELSDIKRHATLEEIESWFKKEAERRGYKENSIIKSLKNGCRIHGLFFNCYNYNKENDGFSIGGIYVYLNNQWAEIVEKPKEYDILSFKSHLNESDISKYWYLLDYFLPQKKYHFNKETNASVVPFDLEYMLSSSTYSIHSVKRLSDKCVFTTGDYLDKYGIIQEIEIDEESNGGLLFICQHGFVCLKYAVQKPQEPEWKKIKSWEDFIKLDYYQKINVYPFKEVDIILKNNKHSIAAWKLRELADYFNSFIEKDEDNYYYRFETIAPIGEKMPVIKKVHPEKVRLNPVLIYFNSREIADHIQEYFGEILNDYLFINS